MEVMRIDTSIVLIPLFGVNVPASSKGIRLSSKASGAEANDRVELGEELQPAGLPPSQEFGSCNPRGGEVLSSRLILRSYS